MRLLRLERQSCNISSALLLRQARQVHLHTPIRISFHTSPRHQFLDSCLSETHTLITGLHTATGLSWAAVLPLTAALVRFCVIAPVTAYVHMTNRRRLEHRPLINQWTNVYRDQVMKDHAAEGPIARQRLLRTKVLRKSSELYSKSGTQRWKSFLGYLQIPVWLTVIETLRRMCGDREGFLGLIRSRVYGSQSDSPLDNQGNLSQPGPPEINVETDGMDMISSVSGLVHEGITEGPLIPLESTLATEGMLWFPNLLLPDPHLILSFTLSASLLANIIYQEHYSRKRGWVPGAVQRGVGIAFKIAAVAVGPLTLSFPSAIHLYLISSSVFGLANTILLRTFLPIPRKIQRIPRKFQRIPTTIQPVKMKTSDGLDKEVLLKWKGAGRRIPVDRRRRDRKRHQR